MTNQSKTQYHHSVLVTHIGNHSATLAATLASIKGHFIERGYSATDSAVRAIAQVDAMVQQQASMFGFLDCFWLLGVIALAGPVLSVFIRKFNQGGGGAAH
jgi:MFS transporter, DHA2 family, multidrug resistance protein